MGAYLVLILCKISASTSNQWVRLKGKVILLPKFFYIAKHHRSHCCRCTIRFLLHIRELSTLIYDVPLKLQHHVQLPLLKIMTPVTWCKEVIWTRQTPISTIMGRLWGGRMGGFPGLLSVNPWLVRGYPHLPRTGQCRGTQNSLVELLTLSKNRSIKWRSTSSCASQEADVLPHMYTIQYMFLTFQDVYMNIIYLLQLILPETYVHI